ncbi:MAG: DUF2000 family protein [Mycobacteriales bacterium]
MTRYLDASGNEYLAMFGQPVMVFQSDASGLTSVLSRAKTRDVKPSIFTSGLFATGNDADNRLVVSQLRYEDLNLAGLAFSADRRTADKVLKGVSLHR